MEPRPLLGPGRSVGRWRVADPLDRARVAPRVGQRFSRGVRHTEVARAGHPDDRVPHAVEASFALVLAGQVIRGRIDAVYAEPAADGADGFLLVDWKTNRHEEADPLQLALYRLAWAELRGVPLGNVRAAFHYVRTGTTVEPDDLPDRQALEAMLG